MAAEGGHMHLVKYLVDVGKAKISEDDRGVRNVLIMIEDKFVLQFKLASFINRRP